MPSPSSPQPHEPTMEEILASIRKIISEDQEAQPAAVTTTASRPAPVTSVAPMDDEEQPEEADVLELTHEVREEAPEPEPEAEPEAEYTPEAAAGSEVPAADDVAFETVEEFQGEHAMAGEDIIPDTARRAMSKAFEPYDRGATAHREAPAPGVDGGHLEAVFSRAVMQSFDPVLRDWIANNSDSVVQHLKPIIREWMDENLPDLIERAVKSEMAAAVRSLGKKR